MKKGIIVCMLLIVSMLADCAVFAQQASSEEDVSVQVITGLNIMTCDENGDFHGNDSISREEFVIAALRALGTGELSANGGADIYRDVTGEYWAYAYIARATQLGLIDGDENGYFYPDAAITSAEANKIVVTMLGYGTVAERRGGYPYWYNAVAGEKGIAAAYAAEGLTRYDAAKLLYNALDVEMMKYDYTGGGMSASKETLLSEKLDVDKGQGIISANSVSGIYAEGQETAEGEVAITDGSVTSVFEIGSTNADMLLGYKVEYYYYSDSNDNSVLLAAVKLRSNEAVTVKARELDEETVNSRIVYTPDNSSKSKYIKVADSTPVLYNGVFRSFAGFAEEGLFLIDSGEIEIIYCQNEISLIKIKEYRDYRIAGKTEKNGVLKLYFEENRYGAAGIELDPEETEYSVFLDGERAKAEDIETGDVISVAADDITLSKPEAAQIIISRAAAEGSVTGYDDEYIYVNGSEYKKAHSFYDTVKLDDNIVLYLNYLGEGAYFTVGASTSWQYGYLTHILEQEFTDGGCYCGFKILTADGEYAIYNGGEKIRINDEKVYYSDVRNVLDSNQLIMFRLLPDGKINEIKTAKKIAAGSSYIGYDKDSFSRDSKQGVSYTYKSTAPVSFSATDSLTGVYSAFLITEDTVVFDVSDDNPDEYYVGRAVDFFDEGISYTVEIYDNNEYLQAAVVVYLGDVSTAEKVGWNNSAFVVDKIRKTVNEDNETEYSIYGYENGEEKILTMGEEKIKDEGGTGIELSKLKRGSVIQYTTNLKDKVNYYRLLYSPSLSTISQKSWKGSDISSQLTTLYGNIYTKSGSSLTFTYDGGASICAYSAIGTHIYLYDSDEGTVEVSSMNEIGVYKNMAGGADLVFMRMYKGNIADILIIR